MFFFTRIPRKYTFFSDYTSKIDGGGIERWSRYESKGVLCRAHHRRIYLDGKSAGTLATNVSGLAASGRHVASSQEVDTVYAFRRGRPEQVWSAKAES